VGALDLLGLGVDLLFALFSAPAETQDQVERGFFLDIVVAEGSSVFELFAGKDEALLIRGDAFLVLNFGLYIVDGVAGFDIKSDGLTREGLDKDLHGGEWFGLFLAAATQTSSR